MKKVSITLSIDDEKLGALEFTLQKEGNSVQKAMDEALRQLYEQKVPQAVREYLDARTAHARPKRPSKPAASRNPAPAKTPAPSAAQGEEDGGSTRCSM